MSNQPQCPIEEIELIPHPMDAWRAALNALIACAPGDGPAIAAHLAEAGEHALVYVNRTGATPGVAKMVDRLMLIGAGRIVGERLSAQSSATDALLHEATRANGKCLLTQAQAQSRSTRLMAEFALSEVHQHQTRENERTKHHVAIRGKRPCPGCNHSPALLRLAGGVVPHDAACPHYKHPDTQRTQADPVAPSSKGTES